MYKKTINYTDYNGDEQTEDFYFNLNEAELIDMALGDDQDFGAKLRSISGESNPKKLVPIFKEIVAKTYGVKSDDGRRFVKSPEVFDEFSQTEAYAVLISELSFDANAAVNFVNGVMPKKFLASISEKVDSSSSDSGVKFDVVD